MLSVGDDEAPLVVVDVKHDQAGEEKIAKLVLEVAVKGDETALKKRKTCGGIDDHCGTR